MHRFQKEFEYLTSEELDRLQDLGEIVLFKKGEIVIKYGKYEPYFYVVLDGIARGYKYTEVGEEHNLFFLEKGQFFLSPEKMLSENQKLNEYIFEAVTLLTVFRIHHDDLVELSTINPKIFTFYHNALKVILRSFLERVSILLIESAKERYLHLDSTRPDITSNAQKRHLAQFLGITPNSLSRILRKINKNRKNNEK